MPCSTTPGMPSTSAHFEGLDFVFWCVQLINHSSKLFNGAQSLQLIAYGLQPPYLRLTTGVTDSRSRLGTRCGGSPLSWPLFQRL